MKKFKITASLLIVGALTLVGTSASAFTSHVSVHSSPHISSRSSVRSSFRSTPKISSNKSFKSRKSSGSSNKSSNKSSKTTGSHSSPSVKKATIGGRSVTKDLDRHTVWNKSSSTTYNDRFYNRYQPYRTSSPSFWSWMFWSSMFSNHNNVSQIEGKVLSKDGHNKITIKSKDLGNTQVTVSSEKYKSVSVGQYIKLK